eukprot:340438-Chlamydomonas_euryale.AAC.1
MSLKCSTPHTMHKRRIAGHLPSMLGRWRGWSTHVTSQTAPLSPLGFRTRALDGSSPVTNVTIPGLAA